jgi:hypothetical protein
MNFQKRSLYCGVLSALALSIAWTSSTPAIRDSQHSVNASTPSKPSANAIKGRMTQAPPAVLKDTTIVPGKKFGPVTNTITYPELVKLFGQDKLTDVRPPDADDTEKEFGTRVNLGPDYSFTLVWRDKTKTSPYEVIDMGPGWQLPTGLKVGMPKEEVKKKLGSFKLVGLEGPYSGVVILNSSPVTKPFFGKMILQLATAPDAAKKFPKEYKALVGELVRDSNDPNWNPLGMRVKYVIILFDRAGKSGAPSGSGVQVAP